jgi:hypothetical protein
MLTAEFGLFLIGVGLVLVIIPCLQKKKPIPQAEEERVSTEPPPKLFASEQVTSQEAITMPPPPPPSPRMDEEYQEYRPTPSLLKSPVRQLRSMGFLEVGKFIHSDGLQLSLRPQHIHDTGVYAFVIEDEIKYIGKTNDLKERMTYYRDSGAHDTDFTNRNVNKNLISSGQTQILFLPKEVISTSAPSQFGIKEDEIDYHIVEAIFIHRYKPPWNYEGRKD